jgi:7-cyano-7-deazaguanine synthase
MSSVMVVLSGGQDSTTCLLLARDLYETVHAITFDYGQRHRIEIEQAREVAKIVGVDSHEVVNVTGLLRGRSPLVNPAQELETYTDAASMDKIIGDRVELTFVPLRNPLFLLVAANYALARDTFDIMTGVCAMDNANYPDCTRDFVYSTEYMIREALGMHRRGYPGPWVKVVAPLLNLTKAETVKLAYDTAGEDLASKALAASHTCYAGQRPPCGVCHACVLRAQGFKEAGVRDPLIAATSA